MLTRNKKIIIYVAVCLILFLTCLLEISFSKAALFSIPETSVFMNEIDKNKYIIIKQPHKAELFRWDFSNINQYVYSFMKKSIVNDNSNLFGIESNKQTTEISIDAKLFINSLGNRTANIVLKDLETVVRNWNDEEKDMQIETKMPSIPVSTITSIDESGRMTFLQNYCSRCLIKL